MEAEKDETLVIFRKWREKDGDVFALFPEIPATNSGYACQSFTHVGEHGGAHYHHCIRQTRPATRREFLSLLVELQGRGYNLRIVQRCPFSVHENRTKSASALMRVLRDRSETHANA